MAVGATAKGKAMPARGVPAKPLEKAGGDQAGEEAPQEGSESTYVFLLYYNSSQSSDAQAQENERQTTKEKPRTPSGERPQTRPGLEARREPSGGREQQPRGPPKDQRRAHLAPGRSGLRRDRRAELVQVLRSADRGAGQPSDRRPSPRKPPRRCRCDPPDRRRRVSPRREERSRSQRRRQSPHRDGRSRSGRRWRSRGCDVERRWSDRPQPRWPGSQDVEDGVQARRGQSRPNHPQEARRQREKGFQASGKAQGWNQAHGDRANAGKRT